MLAIFYISSSIFSKDAIKASREPSHSSPSSWSLFRRVLIDIVWYFGKSQMPSTSPTSLSPFVLAPIFTVAKRSLNRWPGRQHCSLSVLANHFSVETLRQILWACFSSCSIAFARVIFVALTLPPRMITSSSELSSAPGDGWIVPVCQNRRTLQTLSHLSLWLREGSQSLDR